MILYVYPGINGNNIIITFGKNDLLPINHKLPIDFSIKTILL